MTDKTNMSLAEQGDDMVRDLLREIISQTYDLGDSDDVSVALFFFLGRVANTWRSIRTLQKYTKDSDGFMVDAGSLLRAMYDAYLQAEYLVSDSAKSSERARDYFDFEHIERYKAMKRTLSANNWMAKRLQRSPKRSKGQPTNKQHYDRVKCRFQSNPGKDATRNQWYPGTLPAIAEEAGKLDEYKTFLATFNGCVHSSASAVKSGPPICAEHVLIMASTIAAKVARLSVVHNTLTLNTDDQRLLEVLCNSPDDEND